MNLFSETDPLLGFFLTVYQTAASKRITYLVTTFNSSLEERNPTLTTSLGGQICFFDECHWSEN